ncbi:DNA alkylation repair protein [Butyrivibrio sp. AC2005]|jgi:3-methyladenine DNA glycosylase AlkD|uniref:DNA alkylation repair protein n=1 Tax=Butyrivibrio sp. AC2005 TaxID=1280672 RepID=UPI000422972A|nr:DNA alkylation repair protein [Butyrivibrio sp. AC2005]
MTGIIEEIREELFRLQDKKYRNFQVKLIPGMDVDDMIGVRTPDLRKYAKSLAKTEGISEFLNDLPHKYFDENQLQAFIISEIKDFDDCITEVNRFLPYVDNWATCDQMSPKVFKKHKTELLNYIKEWIASDKTYTVRFAIGMLMQHFLDEDFDIAYPKMVAEVRSQEYYVNMMIAWYFATALAKQYEMIIPFITDRCLDRWTHNKAIQKSVESYRITTEQKTYLRSLKLPTKQK